MTEQEKREKVIEEMTTVLDEVDCQDHNVCVEHRNISCNRCCAERLSDYVLRKEKEVQKETAQKIWDELFAGSILMMLARCDYNAEYNEMADEIRRVFKKFGTKIAKIDQ